MATAETQRSLDEVDIHGVLANERRQLTLRFLTDADEPMAVRELSERIAAIETGQDPPPREIRHSAYVSLLQTHLPKLDDLDVVDYDDSAKIVDLSSSADQVAAVMGTESGTSAGEHYLIISVTGLIVLVALSEGIPLLDSVVAVPVAGLLLLLIAGSAAFRAREEGSPILRRLRIR